MLCKRELNASASFRDAKQPFAYLWIHNNDLLGKKKKQQQKKKKKKNTTQSLGRLVLEHSEN